MSDEKPVAGVPEISFEASLTESGVKGSVRSRALTALDRLLGSGLDVISIRIEGWNNEAAARAAVREMLIKKEGDLAVKKMEALQGVGEKILDKFVSDEVRRQANQQAVAREAVEELKTLPPPHESEDDSGDIDDDWLNLFSANAGNATSERLRAVWGRVLAGEIRRPGSFSLSTLRFLSELDREIAESFERNVKARLGIGCIPKPRDMKNDRLLDLTFLEEVGLLQDVNGILGSDLHVNDDGYVNYFLNEAIPGAIFLRMKLTSSRLQLIRITRVGREIASILPVPTSTEVLEGVADSLSESAESISLCLLQSVNHQSIAWRVIKEIKGSSKV